MSEHSQNLNLGLVGNCSYGALIDQQAKVVWACMPRFDSDPVFCSLLNGDSEDQQGMFAIDIMDYSHSEQHYLRNSPALVTVMYDKHGSAVEVTDVAPRFKNFGRIFRPIMLLRQVRPLAGNPRIRVRLRPAYEYGSKSPEITWGSNHIRYVNPGWTARLTTNLSISAVLDETPFVLEEEGCLVLGPDESVEEAVTGFGQRFLQDTLSYWREWCRSLAIPFEYQDEVIRAAITLKLNAYEDTGAIIAAMTTSIPESPDSGRNWDYRYCWLRDGYFVVNALNRLGATQTMEQYLRYIINITANSTNNHLWPVYRINGTRKLEEFQLDSLGGYRNMGPVRIGNQAAEQVQNDVYGSAILATTHVFFDQRLEKPGDQGLFETLEVLGRSALERFDKPDAGLWEFRTTEHVHTYSSVMCWVACDRLAKIATQLKLEKQAGDWRQHADRLRRHIIDAAWNDKLNSFVDAFGGDELDASLLLLDEFGFVEKKDPKFASTVAAIESRLKQGDFMFRYRTEDDFGKPENAFTVCTFWYIDALTSIGRIEEARDLFHDMLQCRNHLGLLSEDIDPATRELWGNYPQTYSMVGIINSAIRLSKPWEDAF